MSTATYKYSSSFTNANFMTIKQPKDQDQHFKSWKNEPRGVSTVDTKTRVSVSCAMCQICCNLQRQLCLTLLADRTNGRAYATVLRPSSSIVCRRL